MSIQINPNVNAVTWEGILSKLGDVEKTTGVDGKDAFTITMNVDGETKVCTISVPTDLELPQTFDEASLDSLVEKLNDSGLNLTSEQLETFKDAVKQAYGTTAKVLASVQANSKGSVMFDIYTLMALLVEVAQKQRDATREMRKAENEAIQKAIQNQADEQRSAAKVGLYVGVTCGLLSAAVSGGMMIAQAKASTQQAQIAGKSDVEGAVIKTDMMKMTDSSANAEQQLATIQGKVEAGVADRVTADFNARVTRGEAGNLQAKVTETRRALDTANGRLAEANRTLEGKQATLAEKQTAAEQAQTAYDNAVRDTGLNEKQATYDQAVADKEQYVAGERAQNREPNPERVAAFDERINTARADLDQAKAAVADDRTRLETARADVQTAQHDVEIAQNFNTAKEAYVKTVQGIGDDYAYKYETALQRRANPPAGADKKQLEADVKTAKDEMLMARALEAKGLAQDGLLSPAEQKTLVRTAKAESDVALHRLNENEDYKDATGRIQRLMGWNGIVQAIGGTLQSMTQNISQMQQANATREGAKKEEQSEMLDQTKDLFQQDQKLIDAVVQLMNAVRQAETQSMRDAIQA